MNAAKVTQHQLHSRRFERAHGTFLFADFGHLEATTDRIPYGHVHILYTWHLARARSHDNCEHMHYAVQIFWLRS